MVSRVGDEWLAVFTKTLEDLSGNISIPQKVYITSDEDLQDWFVSLIEKEKFGQYTMSTQGFEINKLNSEFLKDSYKSSGGAKKDPFLLIGAMFLNKSLMV